MPKVPLLDTDVPAQVTPEFSPAPVLHPPEGAFGADVAAAKARQGETIEKTGDVVTQRIIERQQRLDEQKVLDTQTQFQQDLQQKLTDTETDQKGMPKGYLSRPLAQAHGATVQFDQLAPQLKKQYMDAVQGPESKMMMAKILDAHLTNAREQVIRHEATQTQESFNKSFEDNLKTTIAGAAALEDSGSVSRAIDAAKESSTAGFKHLGYTEAQATAAQQNLASEIVKSAITPLLEKNPKEAQAVLNANKDRMTPLAVAELQKTVDGKMLYDLVNTTWNTVKSDPSFRMADGMIDRTKSDAYVESLGLSPEKTYQVKTHVEHEAMVDYSETMKRRQDSERSFTNDLIDAKGKSVPYAEALKLSGKYGWDSTSIANMQSEVTKLYTDQTDRFSTWIAKQPEPTKAAWSYVEDTVKGKYGNNLGSVPGYATPVKLADAALAELKQDALGKTPAQIRDIVNEKMGKVAIGPGSFLGIPYTKREIGWKAEAGSREGLALAETKLEQDYGANRVSQAKAYLARNGKPVTPLNIKTLMDKTLSGPAEGSQ